MSCLKPCPTALPFWGNELMRSCHFPIKILKLSILSTSNVQPVLISRANIITSNYFTFVCRIMIYHLAESSSWVSKAHTLSTWNPFYRIPKIYPLYLHSIKWIQLQSNSINFIDDLNCEFHFQLISSRLNSITNWFQKKVDLFTCHSEASLCWCTEDLIIIFFCRGVGPWGPNVVRNYTTARFGTYSTGDVLTEEESRLLTGSLG